MDKHGLNNLKAIHRYLKTHTASTGMIARAISINQKEVNNCVRELQRKGLVSEVEKRRCLRAGSLAWWYTSNPKMFPVFGEAAKSNTIIGACSGRVK